MAIITVLLTLCVSMETSALSVDLQILSRLFLPYTYDPFIQYSYDKDAAEQLAYDVEAKLIYSVGNTNIHVIDMTNVNNLQVLHRISKTDVDVTDVELCGDFVFVANDNLANKDQGFVDVYRKYNRATGTMTQVQHIYVGNLPDMILPTRDCSRLVVALEAEPYDDVSSLIDPPGFILIISFMPSPDSLFGMKFLDFKAFDSRLAELEQSGVRQIFKGNNSDNPFSNDIEPEYITFNADETKAYISLQENNAIAVVDMVNERIEDIFGLGFKDWSHEHIDVSDRDNKINLRSWPVYGMYQPDAIKFLRHHGVDYLITANEGDSKDYNHFSEEARVKHYGLSEVFESNATVRATLEKDDALGRLKVTTANGFNPVTQKFDRLYSYGGRGFSIRRAADMQLVWDSDSDMSIRMAALMSGLFNSHMSGMDTVSSSQDTRSDDKGPETESLEIGQFDDITLIFVGNERPGTVAVYSIDTRVPIIAPYFQTILADIPRSDVSWDYLYNHRELSMIDCEDLRFIPARDSPNGKPLLLVTGSRSGTITVVQVNVYGVGSLNDERPGDAPLVDAALVNQSDAETTT